MAWHTLFRRSSSRFISDAFRLYNRMKKMTSLSRIHKQNTSLRSSSSRISQISPNSILQNVLKSNQRCRSPFLDGAKRFYYVDTNKVRHFKPRGHNHWLKERRNLTKLGFFGLLGLGFATPLYLSNLETVPYTNRSRFVIVSTSFEKRITESCMKELRKEFDGKIVPPLHPQSIRLQGILENIVASAPKGTALMTSKSNDDDRSEEEKPMVMMMKKWFKRRPRAADLEGFKWEVTIVSDPSINAFCTTGGKIFVYTGLLDHFTEDAEIAAIIGHEVGHAFARHSAEDISREPMLGIGLAIYEFNITKNDWAFTFIWVIIDQFYQYFFIDNWLLYIMDALFLGLPFSRSVEKEADYIGILLTAAAGYDPRLVPKVFEKFRQVVGEDWPLEDYYSTHPSSKKRVELLSQPEVMEEALSLYKARRGITEQEQEPELESTPTPSESEPEPELEPKLTNPL